jgi:ankyrin repeat protein
VKLDTSLADASAQPLPASDPINAKDAGWGGSTKLGDAAKNGQQGGVVRLLAGRADPNIPNEFGKTPVYMAASYGHLNIIKLLVGGGADLTIAANGGSTPLQRAEKWGHIGTAQLIREKLGC